MHCGAVLTLVTVQVMTPEESIAVASDAAALDRLEERWTEEADELWCVRIFGYVCVSIVA